jgi:tRNA 2-thiocytidine biosynthesis protein TtcA
VVSHRAPDWKLQRARHSLSACLTKLGVKFHIENQDTYSIVKRVIPEGKTMCSL